MNINISKLEEGLEKLKIATLQEKIKEQNIECMMLLRYLEDMKKTILEHEGEYVYNTIMERVNANLTKTHFKKEKPSLVDVRKYLEDKYEKSAELCKSLEEESYLLDEEAKKCLSNYEKYQQEIYKPEPLNFKAKIYETRMEEVEKLLSGELERDEELQ